MSNNTTTCCFVCRRSEPTLSLANNFFHQDCLHCHHCQIQLQKSCYRSEEDRFYCRKDFYKLFGPNCVGCKSVIEFDESAVKLGDHFCHADCVKCSVCREDIAKGQNVALENERLFCEKDYLKEEENEENEENENETKEGEEEENRRRGPRTTIKAKQLEILKAVFDSTPKPTRLMREQLAKDTGLPMRVIQVWFQNKRSKEKRMHQMRLMMANRTIQHHHHHHPPPPPPRSSFDLFPSPPPEIGDYQYHHHQQQVPYFQQPQFLEGCYPSPPPPPTSSEILQHLPTTPLPI